MPRESELDELSTPLAACFARSTRFFFWIFFFLTAETCADVLAELAAGFRLRFAACDLEADAADADDALRVPESSKSLATLAVNESESESESEESPNVFACAFAFVFACVLGFIFFSGTSSLEA